MQSEAKTKPPEAKQLVHIKRSFGIFSYEEGAAMQRKKKKKDKPMIISALRGAAVAMAFTSAALLALALAVKSAKMADGAIVIADQIIKVSGCVLAALIACRGAREKCAARGLAASLVYTGAGFAAFSLIYGELGGMTRLLTDSVMAAIIGAAGGAVFGKLTNSRETAKNT